MENENLVLSYQAAKSCRITWLVTLPYLHVLQYDYCTAAHCGVCAKTICFQDLSSLHLSKRKPSSVIPFNGFKFHLRMYQMVTKAKKTNKMLHD